MPTDGSSIGDCIFDVDCCCTRIIYPIWDLKWVLLFSEKYQTTRSQNRIENKHL